MRIKTLLAWSVVAVLLTLATAAIVFGCGDSGPTPTGSSTGPPTSAEVEATEFQGVRLTPIDKQGNNALKGTQVIGRDSYVLTVDGLVEKPLSLSYKDLQSYEQESWLMNLNCVEGWSFTAKWTVVSPDVV